MDTILEPSAYLQETEPTDSVWAYAHHSMLKRINSSTQSPNDVSTADDDDIFSSWSVTSRWTTPSISPVTGPTPFDGNPGCGDTVRSQPIEAGTTDLSAQYLYDSNTPLQTIEPISTKTSSLQTYRSNSYHSASEPCCEHVAERKQMRRERRREQNRASQRKFRERKATKLREAQDREQFLQIEFTNLQQQFDALYREHTNLLSHLASTSAITS